MAIMQTKRQIKEAEKRNRLIDSARSLFAEHGFEAVTVDDICQAAQVGKSFFYRIVHSKDEMFMVFAGEDRNHYLESHYQYSEDMPFSSLFRNFMHANFDYNKRCGKQESRLSYRSYLQLFQQEIEENHFYQHELMRLVERGMHEQVFSADLTPHEHFQLIHDWIIGFFIGWSLQPDGNEAIEQEYDRIFDSMLDMLLKK